MDKLGKKGQQMCWSMKEDFLVMKYHEEERLRFRVSDLIADWENLPEWQKVIWVYGLKQKMTDQFSALTGEDKVSSVVAAFTTEEIRSLTFSRAGIARESKKDTEDRVRAESIRLMLSVLGGKVPKTSQEKVLSEIGRIANADLRKALLAEAGLTIAKN